MRFLVTGVKGQLGYDVVRELKKRGFNDILEYGKEQMDITNKQQVDDCIIGSEPDVVIHCAAYTAVDKAETDEENAWKVNANATRLIAEACAEVDAKLIYVSTDYVFDGKKKLGETYEVDDEVNPQSVYGSTKYEGEEAAKINPKYFIARTSWVFGVNGNNFVKTMLKLSESMNEVSVVSDQYGSPTYTVDLAKLLVDMALTDKYGTYHANNEGYTNWADFAEEIFRVNGKDMKVNHTTTEEYQANQKAKDPSKVIAPRPTNSCLSKECLDRNGFDRLPSWQDALKRYSQELKDFKEAQEREAQILNYSHRGE